LVNLGSESETCVGSRVRLVGVLISIEKNFYRLPFTPPLSGSPYRSFTVGLSRQLGSSTVAAKVSVATCSFVVTVPGGRGLVDPVVDPHEVGVFSELGDDFSSAYPLSLACDRCDRHKTLLRGGVHLALDLFEGLREVADG
jgi:hypothetical protein